MVELERLYNEYRRQTGIRPTRLYIGPAIYRRMREDIWYASDLFTLYGSSSEIMGLKVFVVSDDPNHIYVC